MRYATLPSGKIKYYWVDRNPVWTSRDPIDGIDGVRKWLLDIISDNESILDIGCGPGHVSEIFRKSYRDNPYLGVDNDLETLNLAKSIFPNEKFELADANFLPYPDKSFDDCILFTVVEMMFDFRKAVEEAVRVAKKRIVITTFVPLTEGADINKHSINSHGDYVVRINQDRFLNHLNSFGFPVTSGTLEHNGKIEYWYWIIKK